ncbi:MAG: hypothetical protein J6O51_11280 [Bacteroidales bacterium]|nr:hypothetical protein [Bacteroidales bacterium]
MANEIDLKKELRNILRYYDKRLDSCTMQEAKSVYRMLVSNMEIDGRIKDFAEFYDTTEGNVRSTINRKLFAKPKRVVLYPFHKFLKIVPEKWKKAWLGKKDQGPE